MGRKIEALECLRGLAALVVVANHLLIGFAPFRSGEFAGARPHPVIGSLWNGLFNGAAAVSFFFVLSGFVLSWGVFRVGEADGETVGAVARGLLKRWPRLAGACTLAVLFSWALFAGGLYRYVEAAGITGSPWLVDFGYAGLPPDFHPSFAAALASGAVWTFLRGDTLFDSALWTMRPEIAGSFAVLLLAPALHILRRPVPILLLSVAVLGFDLRIYVAQFIAGALLARMMWGRSFAVGPIAACCAIALAYVLFAFNGAVGDYRWLDPVMPTDWHYFAILWVPAAMLTIFVAMSSPWLGRLLSGRWARGLGRLSFPIYLLHMPVLCSLGAWVLVRSASVLPIHLAVVLACIATVLGTLAVAWPLGAFDRWWVRCLNRGVARLCSAPPPSQPGYRPIRSILNGSIICTTGLRKRSSDSDSCIATASSPSSRVSSIERE
jgi:peptidoglycan/LPS O-acetylase OafA/YrhL